MPGAPPRSPPARRRLVRRPDNAARRARSFAGAARRRVRDRIRDWRSGSWSPAFDKTASHSFCESGHSPAPTSAATASTGCQACDSFPFDQGAELGEQGGGIMRAGRSLRMVLHAENRFFAVTHPFDGLVVEVDAV